MNNLKELLKLINENPELSVIPMVNNEVCGSDDGYWMASFGKCEIAECTHITMEERVRICFKNDIEEIKNYFYQQIANNDDIEPAAKIKIVSEKLQALEWTKIIIVYLELPE